MEFFARGRHNKNYSLRHCASRVICCLTIVARNIFAAVFSTRCNDSHAVDTKNTLLRDVVLKGELLCSARAPSLQEETNESNSLLAQQQTENTFVQFSRYLRTFACSLIAGITLIATSSLAYAVPTVTSVTATTANGTYKTGNMITIHVQFSQTVLVTGTPQLTLETGSTDAVVNYVLRTGSDTLVFEYTIGAGQASADLDYISTSALALNGGTIEDNANNPADLTLPVPGATNSLAANKALVVDGIAPTVSGVSSSTTDGSYKSGQSISIQVTFSEAVTVTGGPQLTLETGTTDAVVTYASGSGTSSLTSTTWPPHRSL